MPAPEGEYFFHPKRLWRFDFAWTKSKTAIEINGGIFRKRGGAHQGRGHIRDMEKFNAAIELGWVVLQYVPGKIDYDQVKRVLVNRMFALNMNFKLKPKEDDDVKTIEEREKTTNQST